jgi:5-methylcytosine-specific restriction endonuclease McrA
MYDRFERISADSKAIKDATFREFWAEVVECSDLVKQIRTPKRRFWLAEVVQELYEKQGGKCGLTGEPLEPNFEVDHIIPISYGGGNERSNLRLVNRGPNRSRGNRGTDPEDLLRYLEDVYMNR